MSYWIGTHAAITSAEAAASAIVRARPETRDGVPVREEERITERWAIPVEAADGEWWIEALPAMPMPPGLRNAERVKLDYSS